MRCRAYRLSKLDSQELKAKVKKKKDGKAIVNSKGPQFASHGWQRYF